MNIYTRKGMPYLIFSLVQSKVNIKKYNTWRLELQKLFMIDNGSKPVSIRQKELSILRIRAILC